MSRMALLVVALVVLGVVQRVWVRPGFVVGARVRRGLGGVVLPGLLVLMGIGDLARIGSDVRGFDARRLLLGLVALLALEWFRRQRARGSPWIREIRLGLEDLGRVPDPVPSRRNGLPALLAAGTFLAAALGARAWDSWTLFLNHRYLDLVRSSGAAADPWGVLAGSVCTDPLAALPVSLMLAPWAAFLDNPRGILAVRTLAGLALVLAAVGPWLRSRQGWVALILWALLQLDPGTQFHRSAVFEPVFALLFLVNLRMNLSLARSPSFLLVLGLVTGFTFMHKEMNLLNLFLGMLVLARGPEPPKILVRLAAIWALGVALGGLPLWLQVARCGGSEGLNLVPLLALRGAEWTTSMTQSLAHLLSPDALPTELGSILWQRWSLQTVGEVVEGAARSVGPVVLTFCCPVAWLWVRLPREQANRIGLLLAMTALVLGFVWWKGGDSAEAFPLLMPFGMAAAWPFLRGLARCWIDSFRRGAWRSLRALPIHLLVVAQAGAIACWAPPILGTLASFPSLVRWAGSGGRVPSGGGLADAVEGLRRQGVLDDVLVCQGCKDRLDPLFWELADRGIYVVDLDARFHLVEALEQGRWDALGLTLALIPHQASKRMRLGDPVPSGPGGAPERQALLLSDPDGREAARIRGPLGWMRPCMEPVGQSRDGGFLLLRLEMPACRAMLDPARRPADPWLDPPADPGMPGREEGEPWHGR